MITLEIPDPWQAGALHALRAGRDVVVDAPTGAGKTRIFEMLVEAGGFHAARQAVYTTPTRALANDKWREWKARGWNVGIATGDVAENLSAPVIVATLETQRERLLAGRAPAVLVIDEYQMLADARRGLSYELAIALPPVETRLLLLSGSVANPRDVRAWLERLGRPCDLLRETVRPVPLDEVPVESLPQAGPEVRGTWPRIAASVVAAGLAPLLIFAPRRREAEDLATRIAGALSDPLPLSPDDARLLGQPLARLLSRRVAFHHSGLPYAVRADWIERLGKAGELHVIVATTGLAAGINFSVRSVAVASTRYSDGPFQRELRPDELLQMFGRAGRRGLDDRGFVVVTRSSPGLHRAAPRDVRRVDPLDWPTFLRVMESAAARGEPALEAAGEFASRLFSPKQIALDASSAPAAAPDERFAPVRREQLDLDGTWQPAAPAGSFSLAACVVRRKDRWLPALADAGVVGALGPGRLCKIGAHYGKELAVATQGPDGTWRLVKALKGLGAGRTTWTWTELEGLVGPELARRHAPAIFVDMVVHGALAYARLDLRETPVAAVASASDPAVALIAPPTRVRTLTAAGGLRLPDGSERIPPPGSAVAAWLRLGLIDAEGCPTARGRLMARLHGGEGLVVAAALEDADYPVEEIVCHLANVRGGFRFGEFADGPSLRLAAAAHRAYGHLDFDGYLERGVCPGYGEGTFEALTACAAEGLRAVRATDSEIGRGDIERAALEWASLLRHILAAPDPAVPRWNDLTAAAARQLDHVTRQFLPSRHES